MDGSAMVAHGDIVVVSINYRLGLLGNNVVDSNHSRLLRERRN